MTPLERRSVVSLSALYMLRMLGLFMVLPLLALYAADMPGSSAALVGLALGVYGLTQAALQLPFGWLSDHLGRKPVILGGLLLFALGSVIAALADTVWGIVLGRALQGAGAIAATVMAMLADLTRPEQRSKAMAVVGMSIGLSFAVALVLGPLVAGFGGLSLVFWFTAALALAGIGIVQFWVPVPPAAGEHEDVGARRGLIGRSLLDGRLAPLNLGVFSLHFVLVAAFLVVPGILEDGLGIDRARHWVVYLPALGLSLLGMIPLMALAERGGRPRQALLGGVAALAVGVLLLVLVTGNSAYFLAIWLFFVGFNFLEATLPSLVSRTAFPGGKGTAMGVFSTCQFLGAFAGGAIGGRILQQFGAAPLLLGCVLLLALWGLLALCVPVPAGLSGEAASGAKA